MDQGALELVEVFLNLKTVARLKLVGIVVFLLGVGFTLGKWAAGYSIDKIEVENAGLKNQITSLEMSLSNNSARLNIYKSHKEALIDSQLRSGTRYRIDKDLAVYIKP